jgi:hypothetical protein
MMGVRYFFVGKLRGTKNTVVAESIHELAARAVMVVWEIGELGKGEPKPDFSAYAEEDGQRRDLTKDEGAAMDVALRQMGAGCFASVGGTPNRARSRRARPPDGRRGIARPSS